MKSYPLVLLGEILVENRDEVVVNPVETYQTAGVLSFGRGLFHRSEISGSETKYKTLLRLHAGDLVVSRLKAFEGAVAVATEEFDGSVVSPEFPTFRAVQERTNSGYLGYLCRWPGFWDRLRARSKGVGARRERVHASDVLSVLVPLPEPDDQRRITEKLDELTRQWEMLGELSERADTLTSLVTDAAVQEVLDGGAASGWPVRALGDAAEINPRPTQVDASQVVSFVPMAAVDDEKGSIAAAQERSASELGGGYKQFRRGDVIFARITPSMQNGKAAVVDGLPTEYAYGSTEFHVIRPSPDATPYWIHRIVRTSRFRRMAAERFTGTAGQQRVPADFLRSVEIPVPKSISEQLEALQRIDRLVELGRSVRRRRKVQVEKLRALFPSILNSAFSGSA